jgi:hypothetical protein
VSWFNRKALKHAQGAVVGTALVVGSSVASATTAFDTTTVVAAITDAAGAIALLAAAVLAGPIIAVKAWKWLRRAL